MSNHLSSAFRLLAIALAVTFGGAGAHWVEAQSQEPKPTAAATPVGNADEATGELPDTGVDGAHWEAPNHEVTIEWDPAVWAVESEEIGEGYDGLQIGTPVSTVFIEAYESFAGDADACLEGAEREIRDRDIITEVTALSGRPLPDVSGERGPAQLFGIVATFPDGATVRGVEYVECRTIVPGSVVLELTWQTTAAQFNDELPAVGALLSAISLPGEGTGPDLPVLPEIPPLPAPNTARSASAP